MASKTFLTSALRVRLIIDNPNRLRLVQWVNDDWTKFNLGFYYADHEVMDNAIFETMVSVLSAEGKKLPPDAANTLRNGIDLASSTANAVSEMMKANDKAIAIT